MGVRRHLESATQIRGYAVCHQKTRIDSNRKANFQVGIKGMAKMGTCRAGDFKLNGMDA